MNFNESAAIALSACMSFIPEVSAFLYWIAASTISNKTGSFHVFRCLSCCFCSIFFYLSDCLHINGNIPRTSFGFSFTETSMTYHSTYTAHATAIGAIKCTIHVAKSLARSYICRPFHIFDHNDKFAFRWFALSHWWLISRASVKPHNKQFAICGLSPKD